MSSAPLWSSIMTIASSSYHFHLSVTRAQSYIGFPSLLLTSLCALQNQSVTPFLLVNAPLSIGFALIHFLKCAAQSPHGYNVLKRLTNVIKSAVFSFVGFAGNLVAITCSNVHEDRPNILRADSSVIFSAMGDSSNSSGCELPLFVVSLTFWNAFGCSCKMRSGGRYITMKETKTNSVRNIIIGRRDMWREVTQELMDPRK